MSAHSLRYLKLSGSAEQRALAQGKAFHDIFSVMLTDATKIPILPDWLQKMIPEFAFKKYIHLRGSKLLGFHQSVLRNFHGKNIWAELTAMSTGFNINREFLYGLNCIEVIASQMGYSLGCMALAFPANMTAKGETLIGYNHDFPDALKPYLFVRESEPSQGFASLALTYPILLGAIAGVNEKGLVVTLDHAYEKRLTQQPALLVSILVQECLDRCQNVVEAAELIKSVEVPNGSIITLADQSGQRLVYEVSSYRKALRQADQGVLYSFNKYRVKNMELDEIPLHALGTGPNKGHLVHEHNIKREKQFLKIFDEQKIYSDSDIRKLLSDHEGATAGHYGTLCRHHPGTGSTLLSTIIKTTGELKVVFDNPCAKTKYETYTIIPKKKTAQKSRSNSRIKMKHL